jgi:hypothetical protein
LPWWCTVCSPAVHSISTGTRELTRWLERICHDFFFEGSSELGMTNSLNRTPSSLLPRGPSGFASQHPRTAPDASTARQYFQSAGRQVPFRSWQPAGLLKSEAPGVLMRISGRCSL